MKRDVTVEFLSLTSVMMWTSVFLPFFHFDCWC